MIPDRAARILGGLACGVAAGSLILSACGGRGPSLAELRLVSDGLIAEGCYRCLDEAVVRYFGLPRGRPAVARVNDTQLFRALILLALRLTDDNKTKAAELLSVWRPRLLRRIEALEIEGQG